MHILTKSDGANPLYEADALGNVTSYVEEVTLGLSWEAAAQDGTIIGKAKRWGRKQQNMANESDGDAGALFFVGNKPTKYLGFDNFEPFKDESTDRERRSAVHSGDNQTGDGDGDDESITLRLADIPKRFTRIILVVGAYKLGSNIRQMCNIRATIYDGTGGTKTPMAAIEPSLLDFKDILVVASLDREPGTDGRWTLTAEEAIFDINQGDITSLLRNAMNAI